jgi:hypothetical protein
LAPREGFEPPTTCLEGRRSSTELAGRQGEDTRGLEQLRRVSMIVVLRVFPMGKVGPVADPERRRDRPVAAHLVERDRVGGAELGELGPGDLPIGQREARL